MTTKSSGFTLIELLVVVAILGIISAIGIVSYSGYTTSAKRKAAENGMMQISLGQTEYYSDKGAYYSSGCPPTSDTTNDVEKELLGNADVFPEDTYWVCVEVSGNDFTVKAEEAVASADKCKINMNKSGTFTRTDC